MTALLENTVKRRLELLCGGLIEIRLRHGERHRVIRGPGELPTRQHVVEHDVVVLHLEEDRVTVQIVERARIILRTQMELLGDAYRDLLPAEQLLLDRLLQCVDAPLIDEMRAQDMDTDQLPVTRDRHPRHIRIRHQRLDLLRQV